jgi:DNA-binding beta-propeller fold protein YncE
VLRVKKSGTEDGLQIAAVVRSESFEIATGPSDRFPTDVLHRLRRLRIALAMPLLLLGACKGDTIKPGNPLPTLSDVYPGVVTSGGSGITLTVIGDGFINESHAQWNGSDRPTMVEGPTRLTVQLTAQDIATVGEGHLTVGNPPPGGGSQQPVTVPIRPPIQGDPHIVVRTLYAAHRPRSIATANGIFYVAQMDGRSAMKGTVSITTEGTVAPVSVAADQPVDVAIDPSGTRAYTANQSGRSVSIIGMNANPTLADSLSGAIPLPDQAAKLRISADGARLYVSTVEGHVFVVDAGTRQIVATVAVNPNAYGMALDAQNKKLYVSSRNGPVSAIDLSTNQVVRSYAVAAGSERIVLSTDGSTLYVAGQSGLEIIDVAAGTSTRFPGLPTGAMGLSLFRSDTQLLISFPGSGVLDIVDVPTRTVTHTLTNMGLVDDVLYTSFSDLALVADEYGRVFVLRFFF